MIERVAGALSFDRVGLDLQRVTRDLNDLQRQASSGRRAQDLKGYSGVSGLILSMQSTLTQNDAHVDSLGQFVARVKAQDSALESLNDVARDLRLRLNEAATLGDGRNLKEALDRYVSQASAALNLDWGGVYVFGGERTDVPPVRISSSDELLSEPTYFQSSDRAQQIEFGDGQTAAAAEPAHQIAGSLFSAMRLLRERLGPDGRGLDNPTEFDREWLTSLGNRVDADRGEITLAAGRNGDVLRAAENAMIRLEKRSDQLTVALGSRVDADLAQVAVSLSQRRTQYEAIARVLGELRDVNLLNYLR